MVFSTGCTLAPGQQIHLDQQLPPPPSNLPPIKILRIDNDLLQYKQFLVSKRAYQVGSQDVLDITVWDHPELTIPAGEYRTPSQSGIEVGEDGTIFYPFAGRVKVTGLTVEQIRQVLTAKLAEYIRNPQISVRVATFASQSIQVIGEVITPKTLPLTNEPMSVMDAINTAGGMNPQTANASQIFVIREINHTVYIFVFNANDPSILLVGEHFYLKNNDVIFVAPAGLATWNKLLNNIIPAASLAYTVKETV